MPTIEYSYLSKVFLGVQSKLYTPEGSRGIVTFYKLGLLMRSKQQLQQMTEN